MDAAEDAPPEGREAVLTDLSKPPQSRDDVAAYCLFYADVIFVRIGRETFALTEIDSDEEIAALIDHWWERGIYPSRVLEVF